MKVGTENEVLQEEFGEETRRNIWPKRITEVDWFEVMRCANQGPWGKGELGLTLKYRAGESERGI